MKKQMASKGKFDTAKALADRLIEMLDKGVSPWHKSWNCGGLGLPCSSTGRIYRGMNMFILGLMGYANPYWLTFRKAMELGGNVKKGEKGCPVMYWSRREFEVKDENGNVVIGKDGKPEKRSAMLIRGYTVFNATQCEGLPDRFYPKPEDANDNKVVPHKGAEKIWACYKDAPEVRHGGGRCSYSPSEDLIRIPEKRRFDSIEEYWATLFHEGCHSTGHEKRLGRKFGNNFGSEPYAKEELIAEMGAQILCQNCGITRTLENTASYCKNWASAIRSMPDYGKAIVCAAAQAQKAADWIMGVKYKEEKEV